MNAKPLSVANYRGPQELKHAWSMGGRILDLPRRHLDRLVEIIKAIDPADKPRWLLDAETELRVSAGIRRVARLHDIPEDVLHYSNARPEPGYDIAPPRAAWHDTPED